MAVALIQLVVPPESVNEPMSDELSDSFCDATRFESTVVLLLAETIAPSTAMDSPVVVVLSLPATIAVVL